MKTRELAFGEKRRRRGFLWLPRAAPFEPGKGRYLRWLECAEWEEEYHVCACGGGIWFTIRWLDTDRLRKEGA